MSAPFESNTVSVLMLMSPPDPRLDDVVLILLPSSEMFKVLEACTVTVPPASLDTVFRLLIRPPSASIIVGASTCTIPGGPSPWLFAKAPLGKVVSPGTSMPPCTSPAGLVPVKITASRAVTVTFPPRPAPKVALLICPPCMALTICAVTCTLPASPVAFFSLLAEMMLKLSPPKTAYCDRALSAHRHATAVARTKGRTLDLRPTGERQVLGFNLYTPRIARGVLQLAAAMRLGN